jgi:hypothetical protein
MIYACLEERFIYENSELVVKLGVSLRFPVSSYSPVEFPECWGKG